MHKRPARLGLLLILLVSIAWYTIKNPSWPLLSLWRAGRPQPSLKSTSSFTKALVCGRRGQDDTQWIKDLSPGWASYIYAVDDPLAELTVSDNHGFEASFYLTFIIDHYHDLPDVVVFLHGQRYQWHNDDATHDGALMLQRLRLDHVLKAGYTSLRCTWAAHCPVYLTPSLEAPPSMFGMDGEYARAWQKFFPSEAIPKEVGHPCCSQFAVSKEAILRRSHDDYVRYRDTIWNDPTDSMKVGHYMEYLWHVIFGKTAIHCPEPEQCFCDLYGLCASEDVGMTRD